MGFKFDPNGDQIPMGWHLFEITACETKFSKKDERMYKVNMRDVDTGRLHSEYWMVEGAGQPMTIPKLKALGLDLETEVEDADLIGRRFFAELRMSKPKAGSQYGPSPQIGKTSPENDPPKEYNPGPVVPFDGKDEVVVDGDTPW